MKARLTPPASGLLVSFFLIFGFTCIFASPAAAAGEKAPAGAAKKKVVLGADEWCPYNCEPGSAKPGYVIELAKLIFEKNGYDFQYKLVPWEQAKADALHGRISGAVCMEKKEGDDAEKKEDPSGKKKFQYPTNEITVNTSSFFVLASNTWRFDPGSPDASLAALGGKVGIAEGYAFDLHEKLAKKNMLVEVGGTSPLKELMTMLLEGKIKALIDDKTVVTYKAYGMKCARKIQNAGLAEEPRKLYIGFCPECGDEAAVFSKGLDELRASGKLKEVLGSYYLTDWTGK